MGSFINPMGPDAQLQQQQKKQVARAQEDAERVRRRAAAARKSLAGGSSAFAFAGPAGLSANLGAGGVRG